MWIFSQIKGSNFIFILFYFKYRITKNTKMKLKRKKNDIIRGGWFLEVSGYEYKI